MSEMIIGLIVAMLFSAFFSGMEIAFALYTSTSYAGNGTPTTVTFKTPKQYKVYGPVNGQTKQVKTAYGSVGGVTKEIKKIYGSVNGVTKRIY